MVQLSSQEDTKEIFCGGTLISLGYVLHETPCVREKNGAKTETINESKKNCSMVLTAAHCLQDLDDCAFDQE